MQKELIIENKKITIVYNSKSNQKQIPVIILNTYDEDGQDIWNKVKELSNKDYILVTISNINWNKEMSPWYMDRLFKGEEDYIGDADKYLEVLTNKIIPMIKRIIQEELKINDLYFILGGYSLAGLFAIYSLFKTNIFQSVISCSGSMWYPNFINYINSHELKIIPDKVYLSLGDKESNSKNKLMSQVKDKTTMVYNYFLNKDVEIIYEENEGNHFQNVTLRIAKGITWILEMEGEDNV